MARALTTHALHFSADERSVVLRALRDRRAAVQATGCRYWVFEDSRQPGIVLEFLEGPDPGTLTTARERAGLDDADAAIFLEVEL
jgi:hypothetical protein